MPARQPAFRREGGLRSVPGAVHSFLPGTATGSSASTQPR